MPLQKIFSAQMRQASQDAPPTIGFTTKHSTINSGNSIDDIKVACGVDSHDINNAIQQRGIRSTNSVLQTIIALTLAVC
jgi:hypothetical protein